MIAVWNLPFSGKTQIMKGTTQLHTRCYIWVAQSAALKLIANALADLKQAKEFVPTAVVLQSGN
jgi:hypothetical protein